MEFLKSLVPNVISGEGVSDYGGAILKQTGPRLLRMKRLGLLAMGQAIEEDPVDPVVKADPGMCSLRPVRSHQTRFKGTNYSTDCLIIHLISAN